jgi:hypothetical protein
MGHPGTRPGHCNLEGIMVTNGFNSGWGYFMDNAEAHEQTDGFY